MSSIPSRSSGQLAELLVVAVHDQLDDVLERLVHLVGHRLEPFLDLLRPAQLAVRLQAEPLVEVVLARPPRLAADALGQPRGAEREGPRLDRLLERAVAARQLRGDRAAVLRVARDRRAVHQDRGGVVAVVARAGPHRGVQDDQVVARRTCILRTTSPPTAARYNRPMRLFVALVAACLLAPATASATVISSQRRDDHARRHRRRRADQHRGARRARDSSATPTERSASRPGRRTSPARAARRAARTTSSVPSRASRRSSWPAAVATTRSRSA